MKEKDDIKHNKKPQKKSSEMKTTVYTMNDAIILHDNSKEYKREKNQDKKQDKKTAKYVKLNKNFLDDYFKL
tara:strand:+ start:2195 stop:2410 length:216 start_codon:yes stop_codon:yes gene_type:complete